MKAYNELIGNILEDEDRIKFEWAMGAMLTYSIPRTVLIAGPSGSGKTTLTDIIRNILTRFVSDFSPRVAFVDWNGNIPDYPNDTYIFIESNFEPDILNGVLTIRTTGNTIPVNKYHVLMREIRDDLRPIVDECINRYRALGVYHY